MQRVGCIRLILIIQSVIVFRDFWKFNRHIIWYAFEAGLVQSPFFIIFIQLFNGLGDNKSTFTGMVYLFDGFGTKSGITAVNKFCTAKVLEDFSFQRFQGSLFICVSGEKWKSKRYPITVHKHPHLDDRVRTVFFAFAVFSVPIFLLNLKEIVCTVIIQDSIVSLSEKMTVFINFRLDKITFISKNVECPVDVMQLVGWFFQKFRSCFIGRPFTGRF